MHVSQKHKSSFPLPFQYMQMLGDHADRLADAPFLISSMFTEDYSESANRLARSCEEYGLRYILYQVPTIHQSINPRGTADPSLTKANFIHYLLEAHGRPVLYLDVDCVLTDAPGKIGELIHDEYDFAIYNWLADEHTESYKPVEINLRSGNKTQTFTDRFYRFSHCIDYYAVDQLICSGAVQFYNNTEAARALLKRWHGVISEHPHSEDDKCLDYTFNNPYPDIAALKTAWLEKSYARIAWWIYERPVINHPDIPIAGKAFQKIQDRPGNKIFYQERAELRSVKYYFPKDCLIDTENLMLLRLQGGQLTPWRPLTHKLWL